MLTFKCRSLDPQTTYSTADDARFDFSSGSVEEQQASALGNIARPNDFIQFFIATPEVSNPQATYSLGEQRDLVLGTVPSTIDDIPSIGSTTPGNPEHNEIGLMGHFGAVSESGIYLFSKTSHRSPAVETKLDIPHSYLCRTWLPQDEVRAKAMGRR